MFVWGIFICIFLGEIIFSFFDFDGNHFSKRSSKRDLVDNFWTVKRHSIWAKWKKQQKNSSHNLLKTDGMQEYIHGMRASVAMWYAFTKTRLDRNTSHLNPPKVRNFPDKFWTIFYERRITRKRTENPYKQAISLHCRLRRTSWSIEHIENAKIRHHTRKTPRFVSDRRQRQLLFTVHVSGHEILLVKFSRVIRPHGQHKKCHQRHANETQPGSHTQGAKVRGAHAASKAFAFSWVSPAGGLSRIHRWRTDHFFENNPQPLWRALVHVKT